MEIRQIRLDTKFKGVTFLEYNNTVIGQRIDDEVFIDPQNVSKKFLLDFIEFLKDVLTFYRAVKIPDPYKKSRFSFVLSNGVVIRFSCDSLTYWFIMSHLSDRIVNKDLYLGNIIKDYLDKDATPEDIDHRLNEVFEDVYKT